MKGFPMFIDPPTLRIADGWVGKGHYERIGVLEDHGHQYTHIYIYIYIFGLVHNWLCKC